MSDYGATVRIVRKGDTARRVWDYLAHAAARRMGSGARARNVMGRIRAIRWLKGGANLRASREAKRLVTQFS